MQRLVTKYSISFFLLLITIFYFLLILYAIQGKILHIPMSKWPMKVGPLFIFSVFRYCTRLSAELERFYPADIYEKRGFMLARPNRKIATLSTEFSRRKIFFSLLYLSKLLDIRSRHAWLTLIWLGISF